MANRVVKHEAIIFNGIKFYRYPNSKIRTHRVYFHGAGKLLHREVWKSHYGKIPNSHVVHHKDENPLNNDISNLELVHASSHQSEHSNKRILKNKKAFSKFQRNGVVGARAAYKIRPFRQERCIVCGAGYRTNYTKQRLYCGNTCKSKNQKLPEHLKFNRCSAS